MSLASIALLINLFFVDFYVTAPGRQGLSGWFLGSSSDSHEEADDQTLSQHALAEELEAMLEETLDMLEEADGKLAAKEIYNRAKIIDSNKLDRQAILKAQEYAQRMMLEQEGLRVYGQEQQPQRIARELERLPATFEQERSRIIEQRLASVAWMNKCSAALETINQDLSQEQERRLAKIIARGEALQQRLEQSRVEHRETIQALQQRIERARAENWMNNQTVQRFFGYARATWEYLRNEGARRLNRN